MGGSYSPTHRLILAIVVLSIVSVVCAYLVSGPLALLLAAVICALIWLLRPIVMPSHHGNTKVRLFSLIAFFALAGSFGFWSEFVNQFIQALAAEPMVAKATPWLKHIKLENGPSIAVIAIAAVVILGVNYFLRDKSIPGQHPDRFDKDFPELTFEKEREAFCSALDQHLITTDREANWSPQYYTDLDAEVEIQNAIGSTQRKRIADLQHAIQRDRRTQAFLILGDPGSGKSVALRKLARDMLKQADDTGRIPIYVNVREWLRDSDGNGPMWSEASKPEPTDLEDFVVRSLKSRGDVFMEEFVDKYFRKLWQHGRLFFLFDSFDEIPELLDSNEESWLIESLSNVISRVIGSNPHSRGILASRVYRRPTQSFLAGKILEIRPMTEDKIVAAIGRHPEFTEDLKIRLFRDRLDLIPIIRNPLLASLLGEWIKTHHELPNNQADLYSDYLSGRLKKCESKIVQLRLSAEEVMRGASDIAWFIYDSPAYGLEAPVQVIGEQTGEGKAHLIIEVLSYARIARVSQSGTKSFAFSHRRFLEFFITSRLLATPDQIPFEHIPTDSRGRDALVLYAQVCDERASKRLAEHCWHEVRASFDIPDRKLRAIHSLRFLIDAFRSHRHVIAEFAPELGELIKRHTSRGGNLLHAKICLEGTGLLTDEQAIPILKSAMESRNAWLQETAFRGCRQLPKIDVELRKSIGDYILDLPITQLWKNRKSLDFTLSLSESLREVRSVARFRTNNLAWSMATMPFAACISPTTISFSFLFSLFHLALNELTLLLQSDKKTKEIDQGERNPSLPAADQFVRFFRAVSSAFLVIAAFGSLIGADNQAMPFRLAGYISYSTEPNPVAFAALAILAVLICDMTSVFNVFKRVFSSANIKDVAQVSAGIFLIIPAMVLVSYCVDWLLKIMPTVIPAILLILFMLMCLLVIFEATLVSIRERRAFSKIIITERMSRADIVLALANLRSSRKRLALMKKLSEKRVIATGDWPPGFTLSINSDSALTELAKLEERWLGLDR